MQRDCGTIFESKEELYKWRLLGHTYERQLPQDVLRHCLSYDRVKSINLIILVDDNSFKYVFRDENKNRITSYRILIGMGSSQGYISPLNCIWYKKSDQYKEYGAILEEFVNTKSIIVCALDFLFKTDIKNNKLHRLEYFYLHSSKLPNLPRYQLTSFIKPHNKRFAANLKNRIWNYNCIKFNTIWTLLDVMSLPPTGKVEGYRETNCTIVTYPDVSRTSYYVCAPPLWRIGRLFDKKQRGRGSSYTDVSSVLKRSHGISYGRDYFRRSDIEFEDPQLVHKCHRCKNTYFIKVSSLPFFLSLCNDYQWKLLSIWIIRHFSST